MKVITKNPIYYSTEGSNSYSNLDDKSSKDEIIKFQKYANEKGFVNVMGKNVGKPLTIDGKWGGNTTAAWVKYGKEYESVTETKPKDDFQKTETEIKTTKEKDAKKSISERWKGLSKTKKGLIIGGSILAITLVGYSIYSITKKNK